MFDRDCPEGWTRYTEMDRRFPRGGLQAGELGGGEEHAHSFDITARTSKDGAHDHMISVQGESQTSPSLPPYLNLVFCRRD